MGVGTKPRIDLDRYRSMVSEIAQFSKYHFSIFQNHSKGTLMHFHL